MELFRALGAFAEPPSPETARLARLLELERAPSAEEYADTFLLQLYPYASVYLGAEGMLGGDARDRIAGFWRALGVVPPTEPDHLSVMLALYARLIELEQEEEQASRRAARRRARAAYLWEHLLSWLPAYLDKLREIAPSPYAAWGRILDEALTAEARSLESPGELPLHLREAPRFEGAEDRGGETFIAQLLAPVTSGLIITRADLGRASRELSLGLRAGERRFMLRSLLSQDGEATLEWLAGEAQEWSGRHSAREGDLGHVARFWSERARNTQREIQSFQSSKEEAGVGSTSS